MNSETTLLHRQASELVTTADSTLSRREAAGVFAEHADYVWNALRRLGVAAADLEDLTHDTFVAVFKQWHVYDAERPLRPWLFGFALRVASDHRRLARHRVEFSGQGLELPDHAPSPAEQLLQKEREALAHQALQSIELSRRAVFILHELDDCSLREIAGALSIPIGTATSRLRLARQDFAAAVKRLASRQR